MPWENDEKAQLEAIRAGDRRAAETLVETSYAAVYASLVRLCGGDTDLAADLTQETYRKAWEALAGFDGRSAAFTWLYRIAYTTFLNHVRRPRKVIAMDLDEGPQPLDEGPSAFELLRQKEAASRLGRAILELPEELRFTVTAHYWGELSIAEIAAAENLTGAAIRKRLDKACRLLSVVLGKEGR